MPRALTPLLVLAFLGCEETSHKKLTNVSDSFYRRADHHDYKETETYDWHNCGTQALVAVAGTPSCSNDVDITIFDAEGVNVFQKRFHIGHCWHGRKHWDPLPTSAGAPGMWKIVMKFDIEGVDNLVTHITRLGPEQVNVATGVDDEERAFLRWTSVCTEDRDVEESHEMPVHCDGVLVTAKWTALTAGSMEVTAKDAEGLVVYNHLFAPGHSQPHTLASGPGAPGPWTVTFKATDLSSEGLDILVQEK